MAQANHSVAFDEVWNKLIDGIEHIFRFQTIRAPVWMQLYTHIFNYCTVGHSRIDGSSDLYNGLKNYLRIHLENLCQYNLDLSDEDLLRLYLDQWRKYRRSSKLLHGICSYLNRHYIQREYESGNEDIYEIFPMAIQVWQEVFLKLSHQQVTKACLNLIRTERNHQIIDIQSIRDVLQSYVNLNFDEQTMDSNKNIRRVPLTIDVYKAYFEEQFLRDTEQFYRLEVVTCLAQNSVIEYLKKVARRLDEEIDRVQCYLHTSTMEILIGKVGDVLIREQLDVIYAEAKQLVHNERVQELAYLFELISRVPNASQELENIVENDICQTSIETIEHISASAINDLKIYIRTIYDIHHKYLIFVEEAFGGDRRFHAVLDRASACRKFTNNNAVIHAVGDTIKMAELFARYCDKLLRKSDKSVDEFEIETTFNQLQIVLHYIEDKDVYEKFYGKMLAKRLIGQLSASDDHEKLMISIIKQSCGFQYVLKLQQMLQDAHMSKYLTEQYRTYCESRQLSDTIDFSAMVLSSNSWLFSAPSNLVLPSELKSTFDSFTNFYTHLHNGRKLIWLHQHSKGELQTCFTQQKYTLQVSTYQMVVLLLFNQSFELTIEQIQNETQIKTELLLQVLNSLLKWKLLICAQLNDKDLMETDLVMIYTIQLANDFKNNKIRINMNVPLKSIEQRDNEGVHRTIYQDRKLVIQAAIVRTMKAHKMLTQTLLMQKVMHDLSSRFKPNVPMIKKCIEILIEKEYLERQSDDKNILSYLA